MPPDACWPRRDATALKPPRFPILTFDEQQLSVGSGGVFDPKWLIPGESLISILWKFACANALPGYVLVHLLSPDIDPSEGVAPVRDDIELARLSRIVPLPRNVLRASLLDAALLSSFLTGGTSQYHPAFRYCRLCTAHGYHSVLHQLQDEHRCPAHQQPLETHCPECRGETPYIVNANVIESTFRCVWCRSHFSYGRLSLRSTTPAMRRRERIAISRRLLLRSRNYLDAGRC
jgi:hypothetical protein